MLLLLIGFLITPTGCFLGKAAWEEGKILSRRKPISEAIANSRTTPVVRTKLQLVTAARQFAADSLRLRVKESFTSYAQLDRDTLVMLLSAAYRDTLKAYTWWFPIVGRVPYKGFFDFDKARTTAHDLEERGLDIYLRPADAFSTLGFLPDPLLSTTLGRDTLELVNTVIHEVTHNTFYAPNQAIFNESFANFVGYRGAMLFYKSRVKVLQDSAWMKINDEWKDEKLLSEFWGGIYKSLDSAFALHRDKNMRLLVRDSIYSAARTRLINDIGLRFRTIPTWYAQRVSLNNASLLANRIYRTELELFDQVYYRERMDLRRTIGRIISLAKKSPDDPYGAVRNWVARTKNPYE